MDTRRTGRFNKRMSTGNLGVPDDDEPKFVPFIGRKPAVGPRSSQDNLSVDSMAMNKNEDHNTSKYVNCTKMVARRGQSFDMTVVFNRPVYADEFMMEFRISGVTITVHFGSRASSNMWAGEVVGDFQGSTGVLRITPPHDAIVGKYEAVVALLLDDEGFHYAVDKKDEFYLLFNPWCQLDTVYMQNPAEKEEYVLCDYGVIYMGTAYTYRGRPWFYNQFDEGVLRACIHILDNCKTPIQERGNAITVCRQVSAKINSQDMDNGVLMGNWGESFPNGISPLMWTGSREILQKYMTDGMPVKYGQCWVFAGVFNTFLRCMGIPARVVSNFNSAHDNDGNLKTDLYFTEDHMKHPRTTDSIWNFHCWNEVFLSRPDLPHGYGGWQCVDSTPQETSDGFYRCGPASVNAVKEGMVCYGFDTPFVYAEVNSHVVYSICNKYNEKKVFKVDTTLVGFCLVTKGLGNTTAVDITGNYKNQEGSAADKASLAMAESLGLTYDSSGTSSSTLTLSVITEPNIIVGQDVNLTLQFNNQSDEDILFNGSVEGYLVYYTGVDYQHFFKESTVLTVPATTVITWNVTVSKETYQNLGFHNTLMFQLMGMKDVDGDTTVNAVATVCLDTLPLEFDVTPEPKTGQDVFVSVSFTNDSTNTLKNVFIIMEGSGLFYAMWKYFGDVEPHVTISLTTSFKASRPASEHIVAVLISDNIPQMWGEYPITILSHE